MSTGSSLRRRADPQQKRQSHSRSCHLLARSSFLACLPPSSLQWLPYTPPEFLPFLEHLLAPRLTLIQLDSLRHVPELAQIHLPLAPPLILHHLQHEFQFIDIVHEFRLQRLPVLVLLPYLTDLGARGWTDASGGGEQPRAEEVHGGGFAAGFFGLGDVVDGGDVADEGFGHVVDEGHECAMGDVEAFAQGGGTEQGED